MLGNKSSFASLTKKEIPHITVTHCMLHRHALAANSLPEKLKNVLSIAVSAVKYVRGNALKHRLFKAFCNEVGGKHSVLLYHIGVKWLSRSRALIHVFELRKEIEMLFRQQGSSLIVHFESEDFILSQVYLLDIFTHLNDLNISIQGKGINVITGRGKIFAFTSKLSIWKNRIDCKNYANFPKLDEVSTSTTSLPEHIVIQIKEHLQVLSQLFKGYFHHGDVLIHMDE